MSEVLSSGRSCIIRDGLVIDRKSVFDYGIFLIVAVIAMQETIEPDSLPSHLDRNCNLRNVESTDYYSISKDYRDEIQEAIPSFRRVRNISTESISINNLLNAGSGPA